MALLGCRILKNVLDATDGETSSKTKVAAVSFLILTLVSSGAASREFKKADGVHGRQTTSSSAVNSDVEQDGKGKSRDGGAILLVLILNPIEEPSPETPSRAEQIEALPTITSGSNLSVEQSRVPVDAASVDLEAQRPSKPNEDTGDRTSAFICSEMGSVRFSLFPFVPFDIYNLYSSQRDGVFWREQRAGQRDQGYFERGHRHHYHGPDVREAIEVDA